MKQFLLVAFVLLIGFALTDAQTPNSNISPTTAAQDERDKQELIRLTNELSRASVENDAATLERLMDDNLVAFGDNNKSKGKAVLIKQWTTKNPDPTATSSSTPSDFQVYLYDNAAIVVSRITDVDRDKKSETTIRTFAFDVWKRTDKGWHWIASRETLLPERKTINVDTKTLDAYTGQYQAGQGDSFIVKREGNKLMVNSSDGRKFDLSPQTEIEFFSPSHSLMTMFFVRNEKGQVASAILRYYGADMTFKKIK